eukprot:1264891-Pyramimonas_sp.AAC.1
MYRGLRRSARPKPAAHSKFPLSHHHPIRPSQDEAVATAACNKKQSPGPAEKVRGRTTTRHTLHRQLQSELGQQ